MRNALDLLVWVPVQLKVTHLLVGQSSPSSDGDTLSATIQPPNLSSATVSVRLTSASTSAVVPWTGAVNNTDAVNAAAVNPIDFRMLTRHPPSSDDPTPLTCSRQTRSSIHPALDPVHEDISGDHGPAAIRDKVPARHPSVSDQRVAERRTVAI